MLYRVREVGAYEISRLGFHVSPVARNTHTMTRWVVAAQTPPVMASNPCGIFITRLPSIGGTSIHSPFLFKTCSPPVLSCERNVNRPAESLCGPTPCEFGADRGYLTNFSRLIWPLKSSKVSSGRAKHSATRWTKLWASSSILAMYSSTSACAPVHSGYCIASQLMKQPRIIRTGIELENLPGWDLQGVARTDPDSSIPSYQGFQNHIAGSFSFCPHKRGRGKEPSYPA